MQISREQQGKKAFLREQYTEIDKKNRMGKTSDLFKKIGDTNEYFMQRWTQQKNRNAKGLTAVEEIKKRW